MNIEGAKRRKRSLEDLAKEVRDYRLSGSQTRLMQLQARFADAKLSASDWQRFTVQYPGEVEQIISRELGLTDEKIDLLTNGNSESTNWTLASLDLWPRTALENERNALKVKVGIDADQQKRYAILQREILRLEAALNKKEADIVLAETAANRRLAHLENRRLVYRRIFDTFSEEEQTLTDLYAPLKTQLASGKGALSKLRLVIQRHVDLDAWVQRGEQLLDLRKASAFKGDGALRKIVEEDLVPHWRSGSSEDVSIAMRAFLDKYRSQLGAAMPNAFLADQRGEWMLELARWLYSTAHIELQYSLRYDEVAIEKLSPGTRGIVLLLLYLALDKSDLRPLVIDQPEENLDPRSVFEELVPHFREARSRRQVIIVTHNPNLVVNADADQVIVATAIAAPDGGLPLITYRSGSLENAAIRREVCAILEGGERAFMDRAKRYRFVLN